MTPVGAKLASSFLRVAPANLPLLIYRAIGRRGHPRRGPYEPVGEWPARSSIFNICPISILAFLYFPVPRTCMIFHYNLIVRWISLFANVRACIYFLLNCNNNVYNKVYLVTGGFYYSGLDSTEILNHGGGAVEWVTMEPLPSPRYGLKAAQINNRLIITGTVF